MAPEGMVHALEIIHTLLEPGGYLIDIHPSGQPPLIEGWIADQPQSFGYLQETDDFIEYAQANGALAEAIQSGLFYVEQQGLFMFITRADSLGELHTFLTEDYKDAVVPAEVDLLANELSLSAGQIPSIQLSELVLIARLRIISHG